MATPSLRFTGAASDLLPAVLRALGEARVQAHPSGPEHGVLIYYKPEPGALSHDISLGHNLVITGVVVPSEAATGSTVTFRTSLDWLRAQVARVASAAPGAAAAGRHHGAPGAPGPHPQMIESNAASAAGSTDPSPQQWAQCAPRLSEPAASACAALQPPHTHPTALSYGTQPLPWY